MGRTDFVIGSAKLELAMNAIKAARRAGIDLSLVDENLRLTPEQRVLQHDAALELVLAMEAAGRKVKRCKSVNVFNSMRTGETLALLEILALGNRQIEEGKTKSVQSVVLGIRKGYGRK